MLHRSVGVHQGSHHNKWTLDSSIPVYKVRSNKDYVISLTCNRCALGNMSHDHDTVISQTNLDSLWCAQHIINVHVCSEHNDGTMLIL